MVFEQCQRRGTVSPCVAALVALALLVLSVGACGTPDASEQTRTRLPRSTPTTTVGQSDDAGRIGDQGRWPSYIPKDIPALDISIRDVMEGPTSLRIFYQDLTDQHFHQYLRLLEDAGFHLTYVVYQDERYPNDEAAQRRIDAGDFDAVDIKKGGHFLTITYGGGDTVLDIQTLSFEDVYPMTPARDWPADLVGVVPQPEECRIEAVYPQEAGGYQVVCTAGSPEVVESYVRDLLAAGFAPVRTATPGEVDVASSYTDVYGKDDLELTVGSSPSISTVRITVWRVDPSAKPEWPPALEGLVPQPTGSTLTMVNDWGDREYQIVCSGSGDMVARYLAQLVTFGFTDLGRTRMEGGSMVSAVAAKDPFTVDLALGAGDELMIRITDEAISYRD